MHLYQGTSGQFIADAVQARLANQLSDRFFQEFRYRPSPSEVVSLRNSLGAMAHVLQLADLTDQGILVELRFPLLPQPVDVLITGTNPSARDAVVAGSLQAGEISAKPQCRRTDDLGNPPLPIASDMERIESRTNFTAVETDTPGVCSYTWR